MTGEGLEGNCSYIFITDLDGTLNDSGYEEIDLILEDYGTGATLGDLYEAFFRVKERHGGNIHTLEAIDQYPEEFQGILNDDMPPITKSYIEAMGARQPMRPGIDSVTDYVHTLPNAKAYILSAGLDTRINQIENLPSFDNIVSSQAYWSEQERLLEVHNIFGQGKIDAVEKMINNAPTDKVKVVYVGDSYSDLAIIDAFKDNELSVTKEMESLTIFVGSEKHQDAIEDADVWEKLENGEPYSQILPHIQNFFQGKLN